MKSKIDISHRTILFVFGLLASLWFLIQIHQILLIVFVSFIFMSALLPMVEFLEKYNIPRALSIFCIYILVFGSVGFGVSSIVPPLIVQSGRLVQNLPRYIQAISPYYQIDTQSVVAQVAPLGENVFRVVVSIFSDMFTILTVLVVTFYLLLERKYLEMHLQKLFSKEKGEQVINTVHEVEYTLGAWVRGQLLLMLTIGVLTYVGLVFLRVDYALPLAIIAGLLEAVPVVGPIFSSIPAILISLTVSPFLGLTTAALYLLIQQTENHIIVPMVMRQAVGLSPLVTILAIMIGSKVAGVIGTILAIPVVVVLRAVILSVVSLRQKTEDS